MKKIKILILIVSMLFAFNQAIAQNAEHGDTIIQASIGDASNLLPPLPTDGASWDICGLVYNGLLKNEKNLNGKIGVLAESWEISDDNLEIIFHLREGVRWHDGVEFTADDVLFTYQIIIDPKTPTVYSGDFEKVSKVEVLDKYTIKVTYKEVFATALDSWGTSIIPKHLLENEKDITQSPLTRHPIGTGPYKFVEWVTGARIILEANDDYFEGRPYINRFIYRIIPDPATMFMELQAGTLDEMGLTPIQYTRQTDSEKFLKQFNKFSYPSISSYAYLGFNLKDPKFKDKRVRQAFAYAISKADIVRGVLLGLGREATGPYVSDDTLWYYNPDVKKYSLTADVEHILEVLKELKLNPQNVELRMKELEAEYGMSFDYLYAMNPVKKNKVIKVILQILSAFTGTSIPEMEYGPQHSIKELFLEAVENIDVMSDAEIEKAAKEIVREIERQKARYLLKEAGWTDSNGDGVLDKEGQEFEFTLITNQGNQARELTALILQQELAKIGVKEKIKIIEWSSFISEFIDKGNFEAIILGWGLGTDPDQYDIWHSSKQPVKNDKGELVKRGLNFVFFENEEVDELLVKGRRTLNQAERKKYYDQFQEILAEEQPYVFLYVRDATLAVHKRFKGIEPALTGIGHNFIKWHVPKSEQKYITP